MKIRQHADDLILGLVTAFSVVCLAVLVWKATADIRQLAELVPPVEPAHSDRP